MTRRTESGNELARHKYVTMINVFAIGVVVVALVLISYASLLQTISAFKPMADPSLVVMGLGLGVALPTIYGLLFQYGQNVALYISKHYCNDNPLYTIGEIDISSRRIAMTVFWVCAGVDAITNVLWFYKNTERTGDPVIDYMLMGIGYPAMVLIVFAEEVLGFTLQAFRRARIELKSIKDREKAQGMIDEMRGYYPATQPVQSARPSRPAPVENPYLNLRPASTLNRPAPRYPTMPEPEYEDLIN